jgi:hypothetical protein
MSDCYNPYSAKQAADSSKYIVLCRGNEIGTAASLDAVGMVCARDAIAGYPEAASDIMYDAASDVGQILANVAHMAWYRKTLAEWIADDIKVD